MDKYNQGIRIQRPPARLEPIASGDVAGGSWFRDILETLLLALLTFILLNALTTRYEVLSVSMEPTLHEGQYLIVSKINYWLHKPERGDIVVFDPPADNASTIPLIKRIVGLPGEKVEARDGRIWINNVALNESYTSGPLNYMGSWTLGTGEYFALGDNRNNSNDSHSWGPLQGENIIGKTIFRYWPFNKMGTFPTYAFPELEGM